MDKLILIDGNAIMHRAYHALPPLTAKDGSLINAVYGLTTMLLRVIQDLSPTHIAVCFDRPEPTFRNDLSDKYQAQRPKMESDLSPQFGKAKEVLSNMGIPIYEMPGFEADDLLGTLSKKAEEKGFGQVIIITGDKDILQLVDSVVKVYMPIRGLSQSKMMGVNDVEEKMGVTPDLIPDLKALAGDASDNYPGVFGIGPKTASRLLNIYPGVDNIYRHLKDIDEKTRKKLEKGKESAYLSHQLATIIRNIPMDVEFKDMKDWKVDSRRLLELFEKYGFKTLTKRVKEVGNTIEKEKQGNLF